MTGESRSMEQNVLERSGLMKDFLSEKINGLKRERLKEIRNVKGKHYIHSFGRGILPAIGRLGTS